MRRGRKKEKLGVGVVRKRQGDGGVCERESIYLKASFSARLC